MPTNVREKMALLAVTGTSGIAQKINVFVSMVNKTGKEIDTKASQIENRYRHFSSLHKLKTYIVIFQACMDGYTGVNCSTPCPDSFYGQGCLLSCSCSIDLCHHVYGCRISQGTTADVKEFPYSLSASNAVLTPLYSGTKGTEYKERAPATDGFRIASSIFLVLAFILLAFYACSILAPKRSCLKLLIIIRPSAENR
ncbi:uncharacterized protein LOC111103134 isoform X1 [Crassostrea virginica]